MIIPDSAADFAFISGDRVYLCCYKHLEVMATLYRIMDREVEVMGLEPGQGAECEICRHMDDICP